jgi:hypothetical protein
MSYLNCPMCPAQAFPVPANAIGKAFGLETYECISKHQFYVRKETLDGKRVSAEPEEVSGYCC